MMFLFIWRGVKVMSEMSIIFEQIKVHYLTILVLLSIIPTIYIFIFSRTEKDERGEKILSIAYQRTYLFSIACIFLLFIINRFYKISFDEFRGGVIAVLLLANFFLGSALFLLNRKL